MNGSDRQVVLTKPKRIVIHQGAHPDEVVAHFLMLEYLAKKYPSVKDVKVEIVPNGNAPFEGKDGWQNLAEGTYVLGFGGSGPFNHHPNSDFPDICTADQMAMALGIEGLPELQIVLKRTRVNDLKGGGEFVVIAEFLRQADVKTTAEYETALDWVAKYIRPFIEEQRQFHSEALKEEFERTARVWMVKRDGDEIPVVTINGCDDRQIGRFARRETGAEVIVVRRPNGNVAILTYPMRGSQRKRVNIQNTVAMLRMMEQWAMHMDSPEDYYRLLVEDGMKHKWYYMPGSGTVLNGSDTAEVPATLLPLARIEEAIKIGLHFPGYFPWKDWMRSIRMDWPL